MNATELQAVLVAHTAWLTDAPGGERADLAGANLADADLSGAYLSGANLAAASLRWANLTEANLTGATVWPCWKMVKA